MAVSWDQLTKVNEALRLLNITFNIRNYRNSFKRMDSLKAAFQQCTIKITNTLIHLPIDARPHPAIALTMQIIALLQLISIIADPSSQLHTATFWTEPNNYLPPEFTLIAGTLLVVVYIVLLSVRLSQAESDDILIRPTMCLKYLSTVLAYFRMAC